jgi:hypothetical protein
VGIDQLWLLFVLLLAVDGCLSDSTFEVEGEFIRARLMSLMRCLSTCTPDAAQRLAE